MFVCPGIIITATKIDQKKKLYNYLSTIPSEIDTISKILRVLIEQMIFFTLIRYNKTFYYRLNGLKSK